MLGLSKGEAQATLEKINREKYAPIFNSKISPMFLSNPNKAFNDYLKEIVFPLAADIIEKNNQKLEADIRTLLSKI